MSFEILKFDFWYSAKRMYVFKLYDLGDYF